MANLPLAFGELLAGAILVVSGVTGSSIADTINGRVTMHPLSLGGGGGGSSTSSGSSAATPPGGFTPDSWAHALLQSLGAPDTPQNVQAIVAWEKAEGGHWNNSAHFNPLNTTQSAPGASGINSVGVKAYGSWQQGLQATVQTLQNGHYGGVLAALHSGANAQAVANAVASSPWGTAPFQA